MFGSRVPGIGSLGTQWGGGGGGGGALSLPNLVSCCLRQNLIMWPRSEISILLLQLFFFFFKDLFIYLL